MSCELRHPLASGCRSLRIPTTRREHRVWVALFSWGTGFRVWGSGLSLGFRVCLGFRVWSLGFRVPGTIMNFSHKSHYDF